MITKSVRQRLYGYIRGILQERGGQVVAIGGTPDHVHILLELPPSMPIAEAVRLIKCNSSKWLHETFPTHGAFAWQTGYAGFTVSRSVVDKVVAYINNQEDHHRTQGFDAEFVAFLRRHGIAYDQHTSDE